MILLSFLKKIIPRVLPKINNEQRKKSKFQNLYNQQEDVQLISKHLSRYIRSLEY